LLTENQPIRYYVTAQNALRRDALGPVNLGLRFPLASKASRVLRRIPRIRARPISVQGEVRIYGNTKGRNPALCCVCLIPGPASLAGVLGRHIREAGRASPIKRRVT